MSTIVFNKKPHYVFTLTQSGLAVGPPGSDGADGLSAYEVAVANGFSGTKEEWLASLIISLGAGEKSSATDAGTIGQISLGDDYLYVCTRSGTAGNAIWKKALLFLT